MDLDLRLAFRGSRFRLRGLRVENLTLKGLWVGINSGFRLCRFVEGFAGFGVELFFEWWLWAWGCFVFGD